MPTSNPLDAVNELARHIPFDVASVSKSTGVTLAAKEGGSNQYFMIYEGRASSHDAMVQHVELRMRVIPERGRDGLLIVDFAPGDCVSQREAMDKFGESSFMPASPHAPASTPHYLEFTQPWGKLRLGFSREKPSCLVAAVFDATGA